MATLKINAGSKFYFLLLFLIGVNFLKAQNDTVEIAKTIDLARAEFSDHPRKSISLSLKALSLSTEKDEKKFIAKSHNTIGSAYYFLGLYDSAEISHRRALEIQREINDVEGLGRSYTNIGSIYSDKGLNDKAISYFLIAEKKFDLCGYRPGQAKLNNSLGILFYNIKDYTNAIKYYRNGLKIAAGFSDQSLYYSITINLANVLGDADNINGAIELYRGAYSVAKENKEYSSLLVVSNNICQSYLQQYNSDSLKRNLDSARKYDREALLLLKKFEENTQYKELAYTNHAIILSADQNFKEAVPFLDTAILIAKEFKDIQKQIGLYNQLAITLKGDKNMQRAMEALRQSSNLKDTLYTANLEAKLSELNAIHNVEKKETEIGTLNTEKRNQKKVNVLLMVIIGLIFISLIIMIYNYIQKRKDNLLISDQKKEVESKNKIIEDKQHEIIDSITYAKRLQDAILPPDTYFKKYLPESFVLYLPKDIVAGDFYWMEKITSRTGESLILFAAADCTGHGVPGAMVSVVCSNALNRSVLEFKLSDPGEILDKTRELVIATFEKSDTEVKDGMDISFCSFNPLTLQIKWAGANNPLWIIRNNEPLETKADKQPIGKYALEKAFTTHTFQLQKGDQIYLQTDGYADQFGGPKGKKFKYRSLQEKLVSISNLNMSDQKESLLESFASWKNELQQVDDVCIIGMKV